MKAFLAFRWALAALVVVKPGSPGEGVHRLHRRHRSKETHELPEGLPRVIEIDTGSEARIPCFLKRGTSSRNWLWIPRYPTCAGVKGGTNKMATFISDTIPQKSVFLVRFQQRLSEETETINSDLIFFLIIQNTSMNDSGTFFCSVSWERSSDVSLTVKPGYPNGITVEPPKEILQRRQPVNLSCNDCKDQNDDSKAPGDDIITWTLNGKPVSDRSDIEELRNYIIITSLTRRHFGLWNCSRSMCPGEFKSYCLESDFRSSKGDGKEETTSSLTATPTPTTAWDEESPLDPRLIGACVTVLLGFLLLVGAVIFLICRRRQSRSVSEATREQYLQENKDSTGPPGKRDKEETMPDDHVPSEQTDGIQYSTLLFRDPGGHRIKTDQDTSAVIYSNITAACN